MKLLITFITALLSYSSAIAFELYSTSFTPFSMLKEENICLEQNGKNYSPQLSWVNTPQDAQSLVLFVHDPDAPHVRGVGHWLVYMDNPNLSSLNKGQIEEVDNIVFGLNERNENAYVGACPPQGSGIHRYNFILYALNTKLDKETVKKLHQNEFINLYSDKIIKQAVLTGFYKNKSNRLRED